MRDVSQVAREKKLRLDFTNGPTGDAKEVGQFPVVLPATPLRNVETTETAARLIWAASP